MALEREDLPMEMYTAFVIFSVRQVTIVSILFWSMSNSFMFFFLSSLDFLSGGQLTRLRGSSSVSFYTLIGSFDIK